MHASGPDGLPKRVTSETCCALKDQHQIGTIFFSILKLTAGKLVMNTTAVAEA